MKMRARFPRGTGVAVAFWRRVKAPDPLTGLTASSATESVAGKAVRLSASGEEEWYRELGLVEANAATLLFISSAAGEKPALGSVVEWGGESWTVRGLRPLAPNGEVVFSKVAVSR